jgi:hypothetical protein
MALLGACDAAVAVMAVGSPADSGTRAAAISLAIQLAALEGFVGRLGWGVIENKHSTEAESTTRTGASV